jgi:hypothetical protein
MRGGETAIDQQQVIEAEQEHAGEHNKRDAGSNFTDDEGTAQLLATSGLAGGAAL